MKQRTLLLQTRIQLKNAYDNNFPELVRIALENPDASSFIKAFSSWLETMPECEGKDFFRVLLQNEGTVIHEWSKDEDIELSSLKNLWSFLRGEEDNDTGTDLYIDLFTQFQRLA